MMGAGKREREAEEKRDRDKKGRRNILKPRISKEPSSIASDVCVPKPVRRTLIMPLSLSLC